MSSHDQNSSSAPAAEVTLICARFPLAGCLQEADPLAYLRSHREHIPELRGMLLVAVFDAMKRGHPAELNVEHCLYALSEAWLDDIDALRVARTAASESGPCARPCRRLQS